MAGPSCPTPSTVLLVDDEPLVRLVLARMLEESGFSVIQAENGRHALQVSEQVGPAVTLVVTDIQMPLMNGFEFARVFLTRYPGVPFLFITGGEAYAPVTIPTGLPGDLLWKPFGPESLRLKVNNLLATHRHLHSQSA
jgi:CheY-like chemotaxis protein